MKCKNCKNEATIDRSLCQSCLDKARLKSEKRRQVLLSVGKCISCGKNNHLEQKELCQVCLDKKTISSKNRKERYKSENKCAKCSRTKSNVVLWSNACCAGCHLKYKFGFSGTKEEAEKIINDLLIKQNFCCALTGRDLKINKFHIDHIVSRSTDPLRISDPTNWQLIVEDANMFKETASQETIIALARDIVVKALHDGVLCIDDIQKGPK